MKEELAQAKVMQDAGTTICPQKCKSASKEDVAVAVSKCQLDKSIHILL